MIFYFSILANSVIYVQKKYIFALLVAFYKFSDSKHLYWWRAKQRKQHVLLSLDWNIIIRIHLIYYNVTNLFWSTYLTFSLLFSVTITNHNIFR